MSEYYFKKLYRFPQKPIGLFDNQYSIINHDNTYWTIADSMLYHPNGMDETIEYQDLTSGATSLSSTIVSASNATLTDTALAITSSSDTIFLLTETSSNIYILEFDLSLNLVDEYATSLSSGISPQGFEYVDGSLYLYTNPTIYEMVEGETQFNQLNSYDGDTTIDNIITLHSNLIGVEPPTSSTNESADQNFREISLTDGALSEPKISDLQVTHKYLTDSVTGKTIALGDFGEISHQHLEPNQDIKYAAYVTNNCATGELALEGNNNITGLKITFKPDESEIDPETGNIPVTEDLSYTTNDYVYGQEEYPQNINVSSYNYKVVLPVNVTGTLEIGVYGAQPPEPISGINLAENEQINNSFTSLQPLNTDINTPEDLYNIRWGPYENFEIKSDIDMSGSEYQEFPTIKEVNGVIEGNNHTISNLKLVPKHEHDNISFIDTINSSTTFKNLNFDNLVIDSPVNNGDNEHEIAPIVNRIDEGKVINIHVRGEINNINFGAAGFAMTNSYGNIKNCSAKVDLTVDSSASNDFPIAGFIDIHSGGAIENSYYKGSLSGKNEVSGFADQLPSGATYNCYAVSNISTFGSDPITNGFARQMYADTMENCYFDKDVFGGTSDETDAIPLSTDQMTIPRDLDNAYQTWDFVNTWHISEHTNEGYPTLKDVAPPAGYIDIDDIGTLISPVYEELTFTATTSIDDSNVNYSVSGDLTSYFDTSTGQFSWTPSSGDEGTYNMLITAEDSSNGNLDTEAVEITIKTNMEQVSDIEKSELSKVNFKVYNTYANEDNVDITVSGDLTEHYNSHTRTFDWLPELGDAGSYSIDFTLTKGGYQTTQSINIDITPYAESLSVTASGDLVGYFDPATDTFDWTPDYGDFGDYTINFEASDGNSSATETVNIHVTPKLQELSIEDKQIKEYDTVEFKLAPNVGYSKGTDYTATGDLEEYFREYNGLFRWTPVNGDAGEYDMHFEVDIGSDLHFEDDVHFSVSEYETTFTKSGNLTEYFNKEDMEFEWRPDYDDSGVYTIVFEYNGHEYIDTETVNIDIDQVNMPPNINLNTITINENQNLSFTVNFTDIDGNEVTSSASGDLTSHYNPETHRFSWTPGYDDAGSYSITFTADDGELTETYTVNITVRDTNRPPVFDDINDKVVYEGDELRFTIGASDPDSDSITYSAEGLLSKYFDSETRTFSWTPGYDESGLYHITFIADDGDMVSTKEVAIVVKDANRPPIIDPIDDINAYVNEKIEFEVIADDPDIEDDNLYYEAEGKLAKHFDPNNSLFSWTPRDGDEGTYIITFRASDGEMEATEEVKITVQKYDEAYRPSSQASNARHKGTMESAKYNNDFRAAGSNLKFLRNKAEDQTSEQDTKLEDLMAKNERLKTKTKALRDKVTYYREVD